MIEKYIVALGRVCVDEYYETDRWPAMGDKKFVKPMEAKVGGMIANAASVLAGYGMKVFYLDLLPSNSSSTALILEDLKKYFVETNLIQFDSTISNTKCMIFLSKGERVIFITDVERPKISLDPKDLEILLNANYLYSTLPDLQELYDCDYVLQQILKKGGRIAVDVEADSFVNKKEADKYLRYCSTVFMNELAFEKYCEGQNENDTVEHLFNLGCQLLVVSKGVKGCKVFSKDKVFEQGVFKVSTIDTTGAGDTFNSSFLYGIMMDKTLEETAYFASAAAAKAITAVGPRAGVSSVAEVENFIKSYTS